MTNAEIREFKSYVRDTLVRKYHLNEVEALESGSLRGIDSIAENNCRIVFDAAAKQYNIESHSKQAVLILQDGKVVKWLKNGDSYTVTSEAVLQVDGRRDAVKLG